MEFAVNGYSGCVPPHAIFPISLHSSYIHCFYFESFQPGPLVASRPRLAVFIWIKNRRTLMFEHRQEEMEKLMKENEEFLRIYNRHQELDKRVTAAEIGTAPMEDLALNRLKKEKLLAKDKLARILDMAGA
jgi:uncharacterized protein YdcH (DUF465 family)